MRAIWNNYPENFSSFSELFIQLNFLLSIYSYYVLDTVVVRASFMCSLLFNLFQNLFVMLITQDPQIRNLGLNILDGSGTTSMRNLECTYICSVFLSLYLFSPWVLALATGMDQGWRLTQEGSSDSLDHGFAIGIGTGRIKWMTVGVWSEGGS